MSNVVLRGGQKAYLVSFGDTRLGISICRFKQQAESLGVFDNIFIYTEASLPLEFVEYFKDKFYTINARGERLPTRGFGYWCWKPQVILIALEQIQENKDFLESGQCVRGIVLLKKTFKTIQIMQEWLEVFKKHFELIDDSPSKLPNLPDFKENRHDQSV